MKTVLVNLPWSENGRFGVRAGSRWPFTSQPESDGKIHYIPFPFFLAYATSLLKKNKKDVLLLDAIALRLSNEEAVSRIQTYNPQLILVETSTPSFCNDIDIIRNIHEKIPNCKIAICGSHASTFYQKILTEYNFIDYILIGEYELTLLSLISNLEKNSKLDSVLGLAYCKNSQVVLNNKRPTVKNLDDLPWPEREDVPIYNYNDGFANLPQPNVQIIASRGCPFKCNFCLWPQTIYKESRYRKRSAKDVVEEMVFLVDRFNFKAIYFDDDTFNIDKKYALDICKRIKNKEIQIPWAIMARADLMDLDMLINLSSAGLYAVKYGIESADADILKRCAKQLDLKKSVEMIKLTKQLGIKVHLTFCLGLPGENKNTINKTKQFIFDSKPDSFQISLATPFPGTKYFECMEKEHRLSSGNWRDYDGNYKCIINTQDLTSQDLEKALVDFENIKIARD